MARYTNTKEISEAFIRDGWSENTSFSEVTLDEAKEKGLYFAVEAIKKDRKIFRMNISGNIFSDSGGLRAAFFLCTFSKIHISSENKIDEERSKTEYVNY